MSRSTRRSVIGSLLLIGLAVALGIAAWGVRAQRDATAQATPVVDKKADALVRQMSDYLGNVQAFSVKADHIIEVVTEAGQKLEFGATSKIFVQRPDKLRTDRAGEVADISFFYDGKNMSIYGRRAKMYATAAAPPTLDAAIDFGREKLDLEAPGADLLYSDPYRYLMEDVVSGMYVGKTLVHGVTCHHLAFRNPDTDWQLWVADGERPLPCKYVVTSKRMTGAPEFSVELYNWNTEPKMSEDWFTLTPPEDAVQIDFHGMVEAKQERRGAPPKARKVVAGGDLMLPGMSIWAVVGRPATPVSYAGVARRTSRRTARRTTTRYAAGTVSALPSGCVKRTVGGTLYYQCAGTYYRPYYDGPNLIYVPETP